MTTREKRNSILIIAIVIVASVGFSMLIRFRALRNPPAPTSVSVPPALINGALQP